MDGWIVAGHKSELAFGLVGAEDVPVVAMLGRVRPLFYSILNQVDRKDADKTGPASSIRMRVTHCRRSHTLSGS